MTTIAYKDGVLAFDGKMTYYDTVSTLDCIKGVATDTHLAAITGNADYGQALLKWVKDGMPSDKVPKNHDDQTGEAIMFTVDRKGVITEYDKGMLPCTIGKRPFYAHGSGFQLALGAMAAGATAVEAVKIAARFNVHTGGKIRSVQFD